MGMGGVRLVAAFELWNLECYVRSFAVIEAYKLQSKL